MSEPVITYNYKDHLQDYIKMNKEIKELIKNHVQVDGGVTLDQLKNRLTYFSDERIKSLE